jgi:hypothetical protein
MSGELEFAADEILAAGGTDEDVDEVRAERGRSRRTGPVAPRQEAWSGWRFLARAAFFCSVERLISHAL